ncbi:MAG: glycosyltransferase [Caulobacteraceae bacterium]
MCPATRRWTPGRRRGRPRSASATPTPPPLAALHFGEWAALPAQKRWAKFYGRFDLVIAPSRHIAERLADSGVERVRLQPLGVDVETFHPGRADRIGVRRRLGLRPDTRLLVFAGRPAREKNLEALVGAVGLLGPDYRLLLVGAGRDLWDAEGVIRLDYERDPRQLARLLASCDAFVTPTTRSRSGLIVLEALAAGLPVVGPSRGGVAELIDETVGQRAVHATARAWPRRWRPCSPAISTPSPPPPAQRALARHSWDRVFEGLLAIYRDVLRPAAPRPDRPPGSKPDPQTHREIHAERRPRLTGRQPLTAIIAASFRCRGARWPRPSFTPQPESLGRERRGLGDDRADRAGVGQGLRGAGAHHL